MTCSSHPPCSVRAKVISLALSAAFLSQFATTTLANDPPAPGSQEALRAGVDYEGAAAADIDMAFGDSGPGPGAVRGPAVVDALLVLQDGDTPAGTNGPVSSINAPFTNGNGAVGFTGGAEDGAGGTDNFVWFDTGVTFLDADELGFTLSGGESTMGVGDTGEFVYSPSVDGDDAVWTHNGLLQVEGTQAPGFGVGTINTFNSRPQMGPSGRAYWVSGFNESGGISTEGRILYTSSDSTPGNTTVVLRSDDMVGGFTIDRPSGVDFDYHFSDSNAHHIQVLLMDTGSTADDGFVYVDGALVARETDPSGDGDNWDNFDTVSINDSGDYIFSGDTDGDGASDEFLAYNGAIVVREGDVLDGQPLTSAASVQASSINNLGQAAHIWSISGGTEVLFVSCDASDMAATALLVLSTGDELDFDGDTVGDAVVTDFNASTVIGPGLSLAEDGFIYIEVDIDSGGGDQEATVRLEHGCGGAEGEPDEPQASIAVQKAYSDDNPAPAEITLSCNTGLPLQQNYSLDPDRTGNVYVEFIINDFADGEMDCEVTEQVMAGYEPTYLAYNDNLQTGSLDSCVFEAILHGEYAVSNEVEVNHVCFIGNTLLESEVVVNKEWIDENPQFNASNYAEANFSCSNLPNTDFNFTLPLLGGGGQFFGVEGLGPPSAGNLEFNGNPGVDTFLTLGNWDGGTVCSVTEWVVEGGVESDDSDCQNLVIFPGEGAECTLVNTRLYEGIPTLGQYGLALLALLMLGVGLVSYRRLA